MKRIVIIFFIITYTLNAQSQLKALNGDIYNFGVISRGEVVKHTFELKNLSKKTLVIEKVESSCGCTATLISKKTLKPNEIAKITAEFNSEGFTGFQEKLIYVYEKNNPVPIHTLKLQATVKVELEIVPIYMVFDNAVVGVEKQSFVQIINRSDKPIKILKIENPDENLVLKIDKYELKPGEFATIQGIFIPKVSGLIRGSFTIHTNGKQRKFEIRYYSNVKDRL